MRELIKDAWKMRKELGVGFWMLVSFLFLITVASIIAIIILLYLGFVLGL